MMTPFRGFVSISAIAVLVLGVLGVSIGSDAPSATAASCPSSGGATVPEASASGSGITLYGHGWGHSMGMSQYGAQGAALLGCNHDTILRTYYQGTRLTRTSLSSPVRLNLVSSSSYSTVQAENGSVTWAVYLSSGKVARTQAKGQTWTVKSSSYGSRAGIGVFDSSGTRQLWVGSGVALHAEHAGHIVRLRSYSGRSVVKDARLRWGTLDFVRSGSATSVSEKISNDRNGTAVDKYLWGLAEVPVSWPVEALRAQADAARTYLVRNGTSGGAYVIGTTTASQVYTGVAREEQDARYGNRWRSAVSTTSGEIVVDSRGRAIAAMYSSSHGGHSESRAYVYGSQAGYGYLSSVDDSRWDLASDNRRRSWAATFTPASFASKLGFSSVSSVSIGDFGTSTREKGLRVVGVKSGRTVTTYFTGSTVRSKLGLQSAGIRTSVPSPAPSSPGSTSASSKQLLKGDWEGDGHDDIGWYDNGAVSLHLSKGGIVRFRYGFAGATAVAGDWDNNGTDTIGVYANGRWHLRNSNTSGSADRVVGFGDTGDTPVTGRWTGRQGIGVVRGNTWYLRTSVSSGIGQVSFRYGDPNDTPLAVDWNGDNAQTAAVWRSGVFYLGSGLRPQGQAVRSVRFGNPSDRPLLGNWDAQGGGSPVVVRGTRFYWRNDLGSGAGSGSLVFGG